MVSSVNQLHRLFWAIQRRVATSAEYLDLVRAIHAPLADLSAIPSELVQAADESVLRAPHLTLIEDRTQGYYEMRPRGRGAREANSHARQKAAVDE